ncbi:FecCD family ABC transporter permease [Actinoplanes couchii]|uniref:ABC transporter permease n=1 Tax=Actinoplanes couchii TaxID=403638 RepID=A0ABQ3XSF7_9ACTN|nr:iron chelate uptake ABC transporter family permease subunit [Actinoplanes couchii]MDR6320078.1 iron complex transport system permease protein [Actinoplanes couchii]GID61450.1 ABC transporter permease [Actinoplanes couchii]
MRRPAVVVTVLLATALVLAVVAVATGTLPIPLADLWAALIGDGDRRTLFVLRELRGPRIGLALIVGAALGAAGALFQSVTRNPLGSPDIVGFTSGAATGALVAILVLPAGVISAGAGAVAGGFAVALVSVLTGGTGRRLILVGIGLAAFLTSVNSFLLTRASITEAQNAGVWLVGSLNGRGSHLLMSAILTFALLPLAAWYGRGLTILEMGDDKAQSLGVRPDHQRLIAIAVGIGLTGAAVAAAGPVGFVALAAPQLARRLTRVASPMPVVSALVGAVLLLAADMLAQRVLTPQQIPVGAMTGFLGGIYLIMLLRRRTRL